MPINGCCGFWFVVRLPLLHVKHSPPRPSCILWKSWPYSLTIPHLAHCLHHARRVGFCHHPALSHSGSCGPLHQEPGKSRTGLSLSNLSARTCKNIRDVLPSCTFKKKTYNWYYLNSDTIFWYEMPVDWFWVLWPRPGLCRGQGGQSTQVGHWHYQYNDWYLSMYILVNFIKTHRWMPCVDIRQAICKFLDDIGCFSTYCITRIVLSQRHAQTTSPFFAGEKRSM